jgi:hypothetical protein
MQEMAFPRLKIQTFPGGAYPRAERILELKFIEVELKFVEVEIEIRRSRQTNRRSKSNAKTFLRPV